MPYRHATIITRLLPFLLAAVLGATWGLSARAQNVLFNGDFETFNGSDKVPGWTVFGNNNIAEVEDEGSTSPSHSAAFNVGGDSDGNILSQSFSTTTGQVYTLDFDAAIFGQPGATLQLRVQVFGSSSSLVDQTLIPSSANTFDPNLVLFRHYHFTFTAESTTTILQFSDIGLGNSIADTVLDTVSVAPAPSPTPTQNVVANGDFETPPYPPESSVGTVTDWTVGGYGKVALTGEGATTGSHSVTFNPGGDSESNTLLQSFDTVSGQTYTLDFDAGIYGVPDAGSTLQLSVQVSGTETLLTQTVTPPFANTYNPNSVIFQHYHFTFTADSSTTTLQFSDVGFGNSGADTILDTVSVVPIPTPGSPAAFAQWQASHFNATELNDPNISGWSADPDFDGIANGLEYFFHTDPKAITTSDAPALPRVSVESTGSSQYLTFTYRRLMGWAGSPAIVCVSDDLLTWDETESQIEQVGNPIATGDGLTETVTVRLKTPINQGPIPRKFLRLKLTAVE